jgi:hypothetical protein
LDQLFGGEGGGLARTGCVVEDLLDLVEESGVGGVVVFGLAESGGRLEPAVPPQANGQAVEVELSGHSLDAGVVGQGQQDGNATDQPL